MAAGGIRGGAGKGAGKGRRPRSGPIKRRRRESKRSWTESEHSSTACLEIRHRRIRMNLDNSEKTDDDISNFGGHAPMQGFPGGWNPSAQPYPYFPGGWTAALKQGFMPMPFPIPPSPPAAVETVGQSVMKESQGEGEGGSLPSGRRRKVVSSTRIKLGNFFPKGRCVSCEVMVGS